MIPSIEQQKLAVKADAEAQKKLRERHLDDIRKVASTEHGRRVIWWVLSLGGIYRDPFNPSGSVTNLNIGKQQVARSVMSDLMEADEELFFQMQREQKEPKNV